MGESHEDNLAHLLPPAPATTNAQPATRLMLWGLWLAGLAGLVLLAVVGILWLLVTALRIDSLGLVFGGIWLSLAAIWGLLFVGSSVRGDELLPDLDVAAPRRHLDCRGP